MEKLWVGSDDAFFQAVFAYLKRKFEVRITAFPAMQNNTEKSIYHESMVALESVHEVLRKIENSAAPTREDYEKACNENNEKQKQDIIDFYKKLALLDDREFNAFQNFRRHYHFDAVINRYSAFLDEYVILDVEEDRHSKIDGGDKTAQKKFYDKLSRVARAWEQPKFDANKLFQFIEGYQAMLSLSSPPKDQRRYQRIKDSIDEQNDLCEKLLRDYDDLTAAVPQIGVSLVDIIVPYSLRSYGARSESLSTELLTKVIAQLEFAFKQDDGILFIVNHAHVRSNHHFVLSYLVIYKSKIYKSPTEVFEWIQDEVRWIVGRVYADQINEINRKEMLESLYPNETFVGALSSPKQKKAFRDKFLRYFLSSIFLIHLDESEDFEFSAKLRNITLNNYRFFKEKVYDDQVRRESRKNSKKSKQVQPYDLDELSNEIDLGKLDKYFNHRELPTEEIQKIKLIQFLCKQQNITNKSEDVIDDLLRIECFLSRLLCDPVYEFGNSYNRTNFQASPKLAKLSLLFQQFLLVSEMGCVNYGIRLPIQLNLKAISFIEQYDRFFVQVYAVDETPRLRRNLENYKENQLKAVIQQERQKLNKANKQITAIQNYLNQVLEKDVVILRFIFKCGRLGLGEAQKFDEMFRDYSNNLKRRYTQGFQLVGHVGVYIPHRQEHYIDATLIFDNDQQVSDRLKEKRDIEMLQDAVARYWENYVKHKWDQIQEHKTKQKNSKLKSETNPFHCFAGHRLTARSVAVVKTENALNYTCIEIFQGQKAKQRLFLDKVSLYYAHCPMILVKPDEYKSLLRKNCLILGRVRKSKQKISSLDDSYILIEQHENLSVENFTSEKNSEIEAQSITLPSDQAEIMTELNGNLLLVPQADDEQVVNDKFDLQATQSNELDKSITLTINLEEEHEKPIEENMKMDGKVEVRRKRVFAKPVRNRSKG
ncbi:hypothetical protein MMP65_01665 [Acinetobacter sp. ANC 3926]|uniref:hypothetical protein n=1 Tax=Acinetobacter genomosp. 15BJ TaxID=106651 RepID=UPI001F4B3C7C|nr:hypothetical protein [Acinetobacter genomosp. 15BJ]MCH7290179.1 hypothetical protein [Acinetobacter genomosp. 15BJ]